MATAGDKKSNSENTPTEPASSDDHNLGVCSNCSSNRADVSTTKTDDDDTPSVRMRHIHWVCSFGTYEQLVALLKSGVALDVRDQLGRYPVHLAVARGLDRMVELLIKNKASVNKGAFNKYAAMVQGNTPLHVAATCPSANMIDLLCKNGAVIDAVDNDGCTPLMYACRHGNLSNIEKLCEHGPNFNVVSKNGCSLLCYFAILLCSRSDPEIYISTRQLIMKILSKGEVIVNNLHASHSVLEHCIDSYSKNALQLFLDFGADVNFVSRKTLQTPLGLATQFGFVDMAIMCVEAGADVRLTLELNTRSRKHVLWNIIMKCKGTEDERLLLLLYYLESGFCLTSMDSEGCTLLNKFVMGSVLLKQGYREVAELVRAGSPLLHQQVKTAHRGHHSEFCCAVWSGDITLGTFLYECGWVVESEIWIACKPLLANTKELMDRVHVDLHNAKSLRLLCRKAIREHLLELTDNSSIVNRVGRLPLPKRLVRFLDLQNEIDWFLLTKSQEETKPRKK